jgi:hypothetical protein
MACSTSCRTSQPITSASTIRNNPAHRHRKLFFAGSMRLPRAIHPDVPHRKQELVGHRLQLPRRGRRRGLRRSRLEIRRRPHLRVQLQEHRNRLHWYLQQFQASSEADRCLQAVNRQRGGTGVHQEGLQVVGSEAIANHAESRGSSV